MKGISHFVSGIAVATFIPGVLAASTSTQPFIMLLAGVFGVMPDWLDFKFARYFEPAQENISPNPNAFDADAIARRLADSLDRAFRGRPITVQLDAMPLGPDRYRQYTVRFDNDHNEVVITLGPVVNGSQRPLTPAPDLPPGRAKVNAKLNYPCDGDIKIDIFEGPSFEFRREGDSVEVSFLPWRRRWTHSLVLGAAFGVAAGLLLGPTAGLVVAAAYCTHILEDQLGHLGSNLWWPFTERRSSGLKLLHAGDPIPNFLTVWTSAMLVLFNLNRHASPQQFNGGVFLIWAVFVPAALMLGAMAYEAREKTRLREAAARGKDAPAEVEETQV